MSRSRQVVHAMWFGVFAPWALPLWGAVLVWVYRGVEHDPRRGRSVLLGHDTGSWWGDGGFIIEPHALRVIIDEGETWHVACACCPGADGAPGRAVQGIRSIGVRARRHGLVGYAYEARTFEWESFGGVRASGPGDAAVPANTADRVRAICLASGCPAQQALAQRLGARAPVMIVRWRGIMFECFIVVLLVGAGVSGAHGLVWVGARALEENACDRAARARKQGVCVACGYDVRGVGEVCPECGAASRARTGVDHSV